ncbi:MAG: hypothetical protein ACRC6V_12280 [Bacteroidales bacterium]
MIIIEMKLAGEMAQGTQMISLQHISEVEEMGDEVRLHMSSGNSYVVTTETFHAAIASVDGLSYLKFKTEGEEVDNDEVKAVEGEFIPA